MRTNLVARYGRVADKETGEDKSQELLESPKMKGVRKPRPMIDVAKTAGLEKLYRQVYGAMPMEVHSNTFGIEKEEDLDEKRFALLASANSFIECINLIVKNWIVNRKIITVADIYGIPYP